MKKCLLIILGLVLLYGTAMAESSGYGLSFGYGEAHPDIDIYRVGLKKDFPWQWFETEIGYLSGYFELSYNHWEHDTEDIDGVAVSPVFVYYFGDKENLIRPYIEGGIGIAYLDKYNIAGRNLSTNFLFEDRIGVGTTIGFFDLSFRYMHYSNASLKSPNYGIDIFIFTTAIRF